MQWICLDLDNFQYGVIPFWPNGVTALMVLERSNAIDKEHGVVILTADTREEAEKRTREHFRARVRNGRDKCGIVLPNKNNYGELKSVIIETIDAAMVANRGVQKDAAKQLGIARRQLNAYLKNNIELAHWRPRGEYVMRIAK